MIKCEGFEVISIVSDETMGVGLVYASYVRRPSNDDEEHRFKATEGVLWQAVQPDLFIGAGLRSDRIIAEVRKAIRSANDGCEFDLGEAGAFWLLEPSEDAEAVLIWRWNDRVGDCPIGEDVP